MSDALYNGPERRKHSRLLPYPPRVIGRARVRPQHAQHLLALTPGTWYDVIEQPPETLGRRLEEYTWLLLDGRAVHVWAAFLEIDAQPPS